MKNAEYGQQSLFGEIADLPERIRRKKLYSTGVPHPATYSDSILPILAETLDPKIFRVLDPFAGVGKIHELRRMVDWKIETVGIEIEPEWAANHPDTLVGNALDLPFESGYFDAVVTSPTYGNRMADSFNSSDNSIRRTYTHDLGRKLARANSGAMQWGEDYREFHRKAWEEVSRVIKNDGKLVLNISDHIRHGKRQYVSSWHAEILLSLGFAINSMRLVKTPRLREGASASTRIEGEFVFVFDFIGKRD